MRKYLSAISMILFFTLIINQSNAQNVGISDDNSTPNSKAILDVKSTTKGVILPRMTTAQRTGMSLNLTNTAMVVYDTNLKNYFYWDGMEWEYFGGNYWLPIAGVGISSLPLDNHVGIGSSATNTAKLKVTTDDDLYGIHTSAINVTNSSVTAHQIAVSSDIDAIRDGVSISMSSAGGFGLKRGVRSVINLRSGQTEDVFGLYSKINGSSATNNKYGIYADVAGTTDDNNYGVYGKVNGSNSFAIYGVNQDANGFGGYFDGKVAITESLGIGQTDVNSDAALDIDNTDGIININSLNEYAGNSPKWGIYNIVSADGNGGHYGILNRTFSNASATSPSFGSWHEVVDNGASDTYGLYAKTTGVATENNWAGYFNGKVQIINGTTATLPNDGYLMLGEKTGKNVVLDDTRIIARDNGAASNLFLNPYVGDVVIGSPTNSANFRLNLAADSGQDALRVAVGANAKLRVLANGGTVIGSNTTTNIPANGLYVNGNVRLGYTGTDGAAYKLAVNGKMLGEELRIEDSSNWPDYVFAKDYQLKTLEEVEEHINKYSHLPGIPSAAEVEADGILVGAMQKRMMEKIEELTLYLIDMKKENEELKSRVEMLESK